MRLIYKKGVLNHKNTVWLVPSPMVGFKALTISAKLKRVAEELFLNGRPGGAANIIYTGSGLGVLFKYSDSEVNMKRARETARVYRKRIKKEKMK